MTRRYGPVVAGMFLPVAMSPVFAQVQDARPDEARCDVWQRESGFADALAAHDAEAFASYLHPGAVFVGGGEQASHGREAVADAWAGLVEGRELRLRWYPDAVDVSGDGRMALSRGPYWMDDPSLPDDRRYRVGRFISTWVRGEDGRWLVVFDGGGGNLPKPATQADIDALAAARKACPYR